MIKRHPADGARMAGVLHDPELTAMVLHHHERIDGTGYPSGLSGEEIPLGARIIAVADTFDAITSARPYRPARPHKLALDILKDEAGTQVDPAVVQAFLGHYSGRRSVALWSLVANLPQRATSWFGGSFVSVASANKMILVAAVVSSGAGGAAALTRPTSTSHQPTSTSHRARVQPATSAERHPAQLLQATPARPFERPSSQATLTRKRVEHRRAATRATPVGSGSHASQAAGSAAGGPASRPQRPQKAGARAPDGKGAGGKAGHSAGRRNGDHGRVRRADKAPPKAANGAGGSGGGHR